jgi:hypothetical protein
MRGRYRGFAGPLKHRNIFPAKQITQNIGLVRRHMHMNGGEGIPAHNGFHFSNLKITVY